MDVLFIIYFLLPVLISFVVLWHLDSFLIKKIYNPFIIALIEVCVALIILAAGEGVVLYFLFGH